MLFETNLREGRVLKDQFQTTPCAHKGMTVPNFPNLFLLLGPNSVLAHSSVLFMIEWQTEYILNVIIKMSRGDISSVEPREEVTKKFQDEMTQMTETKNFSGQCRSWYKNKDGVNFILWPGSLPRYWWLTRWTNLVEEYKLKLNY